jgi:hypothetical protein
MPNDDELSMLRLFSWELSCEDLVQVRTGDLLGEGSFGQVFSGMWAWPP